MRPAKKWRSGMGAFRTLAWLMLGCIRSARVAPMRKLSFQISSQNETRPLRDLDAERFRFRPAVAADAQENDYCSKVLVPRPLGSDRKTFGLRFH
jgi:hypothetical protein